MYAMWHVPQCASLWHIAESLIKDYSFEHLKCSHCFIFRLDFIVDPSNPHVIYAFLAGVLKHTDEDFTGNNLSN